MKEYNEFYFEMKKRHESDFKGLKYIIAYHPDEARAKARMLHVPDDQKLIYVGQNVYAWGRHFIKVARVTGSHHNEIRRCIQQEKDGDPKMKDFLYTFFFFELLKCDLQKTKNMAPALNEADFTNESLVRDPFLLENLNRAGRDIMGYEGGYYPERDKNLRLDR